MSTEKGCEVNKVKEGERKRKDIYVPSSGPQSVARPKGELDRISKVLREALGRK